MSSTIASVDRALDILLLLYGKNHEMGISEIASELNIYKSTVHRTLITLQNRGFITQNPENDKYWLGHNLYTLGMCVANKNSLVDFISPIADALHTEVYEVINVSVLHFDRVNGYRSVVIYKATDKEQILSVNPSVGSSMDAHASAVGKCLLAYEDVDWDKVSDIGLYRYTENTICDVEQLKNELQQVRDNGYAIDNEERELGLYCMAVPILNRYNEAVAAMSISGPKSRILAGNKEKYLSLLKKNAAKISESIREIRL